MTGPAPKDEMAVDSPWAGVERGGVGFTVASMAPGRLLAELRTEIYRAIAEGASYQTYRERAEALLSGAGWPSRDEGEGS